MPVKIIIVEDDPQTRINITAFLDTCDEFEIAGSYASAEEALNENKFSGCDILLSDIHLPGISGIDLIARVKSVHPDIRPIVLTIFEDDDHVFSALKAGAIGYILKGARPTKLLDAVDEVMGGGSPMSGSIARKVIESFQKKDTLHSTELTERENEILALLAEGYRYKEIADKAGISMETVRTHVRNIYSKLQVQSRTEAINKLRSG